MTTKEQPRTKVDGSLCLASPTGAHHWVVGAPGATMIGKCKHCHEKRSFNPFEESAGPKNSPKQKRGEAELDI